MAIDGNWFSSEETFSRLRSLASNDDEAQRIAIRALANGRILARGLQSIQLADDAEPGSHYGDEPEHIPSKFWERMRRAAETTGRYAGRATSHCDWNGSKFDLHSLDDSWGQHYRGVIFDRATTLTFVSEYKRRGGQGLMEPSEVREWISQCGATSGKVAWADYQSLFSKQRRVKKEEFMSIWQEVNQRTRGRPVGSASGRGNPQ